MIESLIVILIIVAIFGVLVWAVSRISLSPNPSSMSSS